MLFIIFKFLIASSFVPILFKLERTDDVVLSLCKLSLLLLLLVIRLAPPKRVSNFFSVDDTNSELLCLILEADPLVAKVLSLGVPKALPFFFCVALVPYQSFLCSRVILNFLQPRYCQRPKNRLD